jgi:hypothetical protein
MPLQLRPLTDEEETTIERLVRAQRAPVRVVRRACIIQYDPASCTAGADSGHCRAPDQQ